MTPGGTGPLAGGAGRAGPGSGFRTLRTLRRKARRSKTLSSAARAATLDVRLEPRGGPAAGQQLLRAEPEPEAVVPGRRGGRAGSVLRWFTTAVLYAAFLGLVSAGGASSSLASATGDLPGLDLTVPFFL